MDGRQLRVGISSSTRMNCDEPRMGQEQLFRPHLNQATAYEIVGHQMHIVIAEGKTVLSFKARR